MKIYFGAVILALTASLAADDPAPTRQQPAPAQPAKVEVIADLVGEALRVNPAVAAARARWESSRQKIPQATAWPDPMVMVGGTAFNGGTPSMDGEFRYGFKQMIPFPGKKQLARTVAEKEGERVYAEYVVVAQETALGVRKAHTAISLTDERLRKTRELRGWLEAAEKAAAAQVAVNQGLQSDLLQAQTEIAMLELDLTTLVLERVDQVATLNRWVGRRHDAAFGKTELPDEAHAGGDVDEMADYAVDHRPALLALKRETERAKAAIALARKERAPDFEVGLEMQHNLGMMAGHDSGDAEREVMVTIGVSLPIWNLRKYSALVREEQANLKAAQADHADLKARTTEEIHHLLSRIIIAQQTEQAYRKTILPRLVACCLGDLQAYQGGQLDFRRVLESYRQWKKAELERAKALAESLTAIAELDALLGPEWPQLEPEAQPKKGKTK